jgi:hypothetical protein
VDVIFGSVEDVGVPQIMAKRGSVPLPVAFCFPSSEGSRKKGQPEELCDRIATALKGAIPIVSVVSTAKLSTQPIGCSSYLSQT